MTFCVVLRPGLLSLVITVMGFAPGVSVIVRLQVAVPVSDGNKGQRLAYVVREYRGSAPGDAGKDGNKIVVEERIIEIMAVGGEL